MSYTRNTVEKISYVIASIKEIQKGKKWNGGQKDMLICYGAC